MNEIGIVVGRRSHAEILEEFAKDGLEFVLYDAPEGLYMPEVFGAGALTIKDDESHKGYRSLCPFPHTVIEVTNVPKLAATMRKFVEERGGYVRDSGGYTIPMQTPEGVNPDYDLLVKLDELEGIDIPTRNALASMAHKEPAAFLVLVETLDVYSEGLAQEPAPRCP